MKNTKGKSEMGFICCLCKKKSFGWGDNKQFGNNPQPIMDGHCCDDCNFKKVIPERLRRMKE